MRKLFLAVAILVVPLPVLAGGFDYQSRILLHGQKTLSQHFGLAGWGIVPDTTNQNPRGLLLGGFFYKDESRWIEVMGGTFMDGGREEPLFDLRYSEKGLPQPFEGWLEVVYSPGPDKLLLSPSLVWPTPLSIFEAPIKIGGEADIFLVKENVSRGIGPRVVFPLPIKGWTLAVAYQFKERGQEDILRTYLILNF